jgi:hypothetical protein
MATSVVNGSVVLRTLGIDVQSFVGTDFKIGQLVRHLDTREAGEIMAILSGRVAVVYFNRDVIKVDRHVSVLLSRLERFSETDVAIFPPMQHRPCV